MRTDKTFRESDRGLMLIKCGVEQVLETDRITEIRKVVEQGAVVVLKTAFSSDDVALLRDHVLSWRENIPNIGFDIDTNTPNINFHRIDSDPEKSKLPHIFHQHGFGDLNSLPKPLGCELEEIAGKMLDVQNAVAQTAFRLRDPEIRIKALQYPRGGGFLQQHGHPLLPQKVGLILSMAEMQKDFTGGGTVFLTSRGLVDTSKHHNMGDLILFRYDLIHAVTEIDSDEEIDWAKENGRWSLVLELISTHGRSEVS